MDANVDLKQRREIGKYVKITKILTFDHLGRNISIKTM